MHATRYDFESSLDFEVVSQDTQHKLLQMKSVFSLSFLQSKYTKRKQHFAQRFGRTVRKCMQSDAIQISIQATRLLLHHLLKHATSLHALVMPLPLQVLGRNCDDNGLQGLVVFELACRILFASARPAHVSSSAYDSKVNAQQSSGDHRTR